jgi:hypothetical protein
MSNEVEKFDPATLMDGVRKRIKATFVSLIPDDKWSELCTNQMNDFFERKRDRYNDKFIPCEFDNICNTVLRAIASEKIKEALVKYDSQVWSNCEPVVNDLILELLKKNASELFAAMISNQVQRVIQDMKSRGY